LIMAFFELWYFTR